MKKSISLGLMAAMLFTLGACTQQTAKVEDDGPTAALKECVIETQKGNYKAIYEAISPKSEHLLAGLAKDSAFCEHFIEYNRQQFEMRGGVKDFKVLSSKISESGDSAVLETVYTFGNGERKEDTQRMIKVDGKWYMDE